MRWLEVLPEAYAVQVLTDDAGLPAEEAPSSASGRSAPTRAVSDEVVTALLHG